MKTITKVALASSVGLMLCGAVMCAVGAGMGGRAAAMELTDLSPYMSLRNGLTVGYDAMDDLSKEGDYELKFDSSDVSNVNIEIGASDVKITDNTKDDNIYVTIKNASYASKDYDREFGLKVKGNTNGKSHVIIQMPKGREYNSVNFSVGATDMEIESLICNGLVINSGAGNVTIGDLISADYADLNVGAGSLVIKNGKVKDLTIECGAGDVQFNGYIEDDLDAECGMGNISLTLAGKSEDHVISYKAAMGNVTFNGVKTSGIVSHEEIGTDEDSVYEIECSMGNIDITFNED